MTCATSEGSDQPGHPPGLIRVFTARIKQAWIISYIVSIERTAKALIRLGIRIILLFYRAAAQMVLQKELTMISSDRSASVF